VSPSPLTPIPRMFLLAKNCPGRDRRHTTVNGVKPVRRVQEVGGRLRGAADSGKLSNGPRFDSSSKSPAYFLNSSHGFNAVHGRMPAIATGAISPIGTFSESGSAVDGDTASIGLGEFMHLMRRNLPLIYIIENNGVYGLTERAVFRDCGPRFKTEDGRRE